MLIALIIAFNIFDIVVHAIYITALVFLFLFLKMKHKRSLTDYKERMYEYFEEQTNDLREQNVILQKKNKKNEELVSNLLPQQTANELKADGKAISRRFEVVTILFADVKGFTKIAEQMNPEVLIDQLDKIFFYFDSIAEKYNIEKIKTIGDAYMCAGGIPVKNKTNPVEVVLAALEMQEYLSQLHKDTTNNYAKIWNLRIGVHTGPVVAGVIGKKKFSYDIWGDSVNVASRMESSGDIGKVNVSSITHQYTENFFDFEYRGRMPVKYKGEIEMYFVKGIKSDLSEFGSGVLTNRKFKAKLTLLRLNEIEEFIEEKLTKELSSSMYFHNASQTHDFANTVELICLGEHIEVEDMLVVKTAATLYASGFVIQYENYREKSIEFAKEILPGYEYTKNQIEKVCEIIESSKNLFSAENKFVAVFADAYLDFYGSYQYIQKLNLLFNELNENKQILDKKDWYNHQLNNLKKHNFYTPTARILRDVCKEDQVKKLLKEIALFE